jgi:hypothetical protein
MYYKYLLFSYWYWAVNLNLIWSIYYWKFFNSYFYNLEYDWFPVGLLKFRVLLFYFYKTFYINRQCFIIFLKYFISWFLVFAIPKNYWITVNCFQYLSRLKHLSLLIHWIRFDRRKFNLMDNLNSYSLRLKQGASERLVWHQKYCCP